MASYFIREKAHVSLVEDVPYFDARDNQMKTRQQAKYVAGQFPSQRKAKRWITQVSPAVRF